MNYQAIPWCFPDFSHQQQDWRFGMLQMHQPSNDFASKPLLIWYIYRGIILQQIYTRGLFSSYPIGIPINQPGFNGSCRTEGWVLILRCLPTCCLWDDPEVQWEASHWSCRTTGRLVRFQKRWRRVGKGNNKLCQGKRMGVYTPTVRVGRIWCLAGVLYNNSWGLYTHKIAT